MAVEPINPVVIQQFFTRSFTVAPGTVLIARDVVLADGETILVEDTGELLLI